MLKEFDQQVGLKYLKAIHLNDSKGTASTYKKHNMDWHGLHQVCITTTGKLGCNLDRHEDIGKGHIGISAFRDIVNEPSLDHIPLILETPGR